VELISGRADGERGLYVTFNGVTAAFVNANDSGLEEMAEKYRGMRIFEVAMEEKSMRHFMWNNLDYALKLRGIR